MMVLSAVAYPGRFRLYALATMVVVVGFGMASGLAMRGVEQNDTPWAGASSGSTPTPTSHGLVVSSPRPNQG
jgi:hypothetical protein